MLYTGKYFGDTLSSFKYETFKGVGIIKLRLCSRVYEVRFAKFLSFTSAEKK